MRRPWCIMGQRHGYAGRDANRWHPLIVGSFESLVSKRINHWRGSPRAAVWQRNYYEHVIRNEHEWERIRPYIADNPLQWASDTENPEVVAAQHAPVRPWT
ncbi:MAG: hypothetical protein N3C12_05545 [Candidatus Binatia bacterium]|nr:hypothetical protein [Candidatus Binatia bacterium]